jgi:hypothetical protein
MTMKNHKLLLSFALVLCCGTSWADTLCKPDEIIYFSCKIKDNLKIVSLCGNAFWNPTDGQVSKDAWLQYRFGKPGKLELAYPTNQEDSLTKFRGENLRRGRGFDTAVSFTNQGMTYALEILEGAEREEDNFYGVELAAVNNDPKIKLPIRLSCQGMPKTEFADGGDFFSLARELERQVDLKN